MLLYLAQQITVAVDGIVDTGCAQRLPVYRRVASDHRLAARTFEFVDKTDHRQGGADLRQRIAVAVQQFEREFANLRYRRFADGRQARRFGAANRDDFEAAGLDIGFDLLMDLGFNSTDASIKSRIFYQYLIGYHEMLRNQEQPQDYVRSAKEEINHSDVK